MSTLGAMGAHDELSKLRQIAGVSDALNQALAVSGDAASLLEIAADTSDPDRQVRAITALGIVGCLPASPPGYPARRSSAFRPTGGTSGRSNRCRGCNVGVVRAGAAPPSNCTVGA